MTELVPPLRHPVARVLLGAFVLLHVVLALAATGPTVPTLLALVLICAAAGAVVLPADLPRIGLVGAMAAALVASGLILATLPLAGWPGYAAWPLGAATFIALGLALRARTAAAWTLLGGVAVESVVWSLLHGAGPLPGVDLVIRHAGTLLLGSLFAVALQRSAVTLRAYRRAEQQRAVLRAATAAAGAEQRRAADRFLGLAGPLLRRLADGGQASPPELLALEGRLRDEVTAPALLTDRLNEALAAARGRGVDVVLLGDATSLAMPPEQRDALARWLTAHLDRSVDGRFVGRVTVDESVVRVAARSDEVAEVRDFALELRSRTRPGAPTPTPD